MITKIETLKSVKDSLLFLADSVLDEKYDKVSVFRELCRLAGRVDFVLESLTALNNDIKMIDCYGTSTIDK